MKFFKNYREFLYENNNSPSKDIFLNEKSDHEGWLVVGYDKKTRKAEILSIPLIRKEAVRFLQNFEAQLSKMADKFKIYSKLDIVHASEVFEHNLLINESKNIKMIHKDIDSILSKHSDMINNTYGISSDDFDKVSLDISNYILKTFK
jgi:hypothetical protein